ncbi:zinc-dependent alcohol dehydrogenase family protein [Mycobacteroides abscessus]|uniref:zinc-dependent alcohol dehydrogenase family protein n=1 Tax=Mycobacteroides abscessus TaxID=36809 RepID=UPI002103EB11|nr:zinc-dependent alcohol dehydrogenase family protein [Mycobacteroides abscessus]
MEALRFSSFGNPRDVVELVQIDEPGPPGSKEVLVQVDFAPINPSELLMIRGHYGVKPPLPALLGQEGSASVLAVGESVTKLQVGDRVILPAGRSVWRERLVVSADSLTVAPAGIDPRQLAMVRVNAPTAGLLLHEFSALRAGDWIIQNAGNSGVGRNVIAFAREAGVKVVSLVRRKDQIRDVTLAGSDVVLVEHPQVAKEVSAATGGAPISLAFDGVAGESTASLVTSVAPKGTVVLYAGMSGRAAQVNPLLVIFGDVRVVGFWLGSSAWRSAPQIGEHVATAVRLIGDGKLRVPVAATYPLAAAAEAIEHAERGGGKVLFQPAA